VGITGRKRTLGARGWSESKVESEKAEEKKRRNKTITKERNKEKRRGFKRERVKENDMLYDRENRSHPQW